MNKPSIYQNLIDNYTISSYDFLKEPYQEKALMSIIFSKFLTDTKYTINIQKYIDFILKENYISFYKDENMIKNTIYYEDNMKISNDIPKTNILIIDFDISSYSSNYIKYYLLYLDIISQIYIHAFNIKDNIGSHKRILELNLKSRYSARTTSLNEIIINHNNVYNFVIKIIRTDDINYDVSDIQIDSTDNIKKIILLFKSDIIRHLRYLAGDDVQLTNKKYLENISYFYKFCRIKLMYSIIHSIYLLSLKPTNTIAIQDSIMNYIITNILPVFNNFKEISYYLNNDENITKKKLLYTTKVIKTTNNISKLNESILQTKNVLIKNKLLSNSIDKKTTDIFIIEKISLVIFMIICSIILFVVLQSNSNKILIFSLMTYIVIAIYVIIYMYMSLRTNVEEHFEVLTAYPMIKPITNNYAYDNGIIVRINASNNDVNVFKVFDKNENSIFNIKDAYLNTQIAKNTYRSDYAGEYIKIDLGEYIILKKYLLVGNIKSFKIYASNENLAWYNINHISWTELDIQENVNQILFDIDNNIHYRYYMIIINKITTNTSLDINSCELYGTKYIRTVTLSSSPTNINSQTNISIYPLEELNLPTDYDDIGLIEWSGYATSYKSDGIDETYACIWTNHTPLCFPTLISTNNTLYANINHVKTPFINRKISTYIDILGSQKFESLYYTITIQYYPSVSKNERIDIIKNIENNTERKRIAETYYLKYKNDYDMAVQEANKLKNEFNNMSTDITNTNTQFIFNKTKTMLNNANTRINIFEIDMLSMQKILETKTGIDEKKMAEDFTRISSEQQNNIITVNNINNIRNEALQKLDIYLTNNDLSETAMILYYNAETQNNIFKNYASKTELHATKMEAEQKNIAEEISRNEVEIAFRNLDIARNNILKQQIDISNSPLISQILAEQRNIQKYQKLYEIAINDKQNAENKLVFAVSKDYKSEIDSLNLDIRIASEKMTKSLSDKEFSIQKLEKLKTSVIESTIKSIMIVNDRILSDISDNIKIFNDKIKQINNKIQTSKRNKISLETNLQTDNKIQISNQIRIENYKIQKKNYILDYIKLCLQREEKAKTTYITANNKQKLNEKITNQIENELKLNQFQKSESSKPVISKLFVDIDVILINNINDYINEINHDLILPPLESEHKQFKEHDINVKSYIDVSKNDLNVKKVDTIENKAEIHLYLSLSVLLSIIATLWYYLTPKIAIIIGVILFIIIITIYIIHYLIIVRTKAKNKYWISPKSRNIEI